MSKGSKCPISKDSITAIAMAVTVYGLIALCHFNVIEAGVQLLVLLFAFSLAIATIVIGFVSIRSARLADQRTVSIVFSVLSVLLSILALILTRQLFEEASNHLFIYID